MTEMIDTILLVDDEPHQIAAMTRQLQKTFSIKTAASGTEALACLETQGPFAVVLSDCRMPGMDGITLLSEFRKRSPDTVRIMLTGRADLQTAVAAVNNGQVFRFLTKPCTTDVISQTLSLALRHFQIQQHERSLLNKTVKGSISMLAELLSLSDPQAFSSGYRIKQTVKTLAEELDLHPAWQFEIAALISQCGCIAVPADILKKKRAGEPLTDQELRIYRDHPRVGARLVEKIPRLEKTAIIIKNQLLDFRDLQLMADELPKPLLTGAAILRAVLDYDAHTSLGISHEEAMRRLYERGENYDPDVLEVLDKCEQPALSDRTLHSLRFDELVPGMVAAEDIVGKTGSLIIARGQEITWPVLQGLNNYSEHIGIQEPISVWYAANYGE